MPDVCTTSKSSGRCPMYARMSGRILSIVYESSKFYRVYSTARYKISIHTIDMEANEEANPIFAESAFLRTRGDSSLEKMQTMLLPLTYMSSVILDLPDKKFIVMVTPKDQITPLISTIFKCKRHCKIDRC